MFNDLFAGVEEKKNEGLLAQEEGKTASTETVIESAPAVKVDVVPDVSPTQDVCGDEGEASGDSPMEETVSEEEMPEDAAGTDEDAAQGSDESEESDSANGGFMTNLFGDMVDAKGGKKGKADNKSAVQKPAASKPAAAPTKKAFNDTSSLKLPHTVEILQRVVTLTADDFGGASEVTGEEIRNHFARSLNVMSLRRSDMVVFALIEPNKESEDNYLFIDVKSPKQGCLDPLSLPLGRVAQDPTEPDKVLFRTRAGVFRRPKKNVGGATFEWMLPQIPRSILVQAVGFFRRVYGLYGTESKGYILFNPVLKQYEFWVPPQECSKSTVQADADDYRSGYVHIMDIHSHGEYEARFSKIRDDKAAIEMNLIELQGVVGEFGSTNLSETFRVVFSGSFGEVPVSDLFSDVQSVNELEDFIPPQEWIQRVRVISHSYQKCEGSDW